MGTQYQHGSGLVCGGLMTPYIETVSKLYLYTTFVGRLLLIHSGTHAQFDMERLKEENSVHTINVIECILFFK